MVAESGLESIPTDLQVFFPPHLVSENHRLWGWKGPLKPASPGITNSDIAGARQVLSMCDSASMGQ